ncbi:MAG: hypothetical protein JST00_09685 [Deltaproteobacteria bacterium]|nr:hypothetical protein [Deltaproteobacteria bacterium]
MRRAAIATATVLAVAVPAWSLGCDGGGGGDDETIPVAKAPPSRHGAMRDALTADARGFAFADGDWQEDLGDAPFFGLAWLSRRAASAPLDAADAARRDAALARARTLLGGDLLSGDVQERVMAALGILEHVAATKDASEVANVDAFLDRLDGVVSALGDYLDGASDASWAVRTYGPTAVTALVALVHAQYAFYVDGPRKAERRDRAIALERTIVDKALVDLTDPASGRSVRGFAISPAKPALELYPNVSMMMLEARLFRLTKNETYRLQARALYAAVQPLKLSSEPARYASPYATELVGAKTRDVSTLSSQNYLALALSLLFEITGEARFAEEADRVLDAIEKLRGPWCIAQVTHAGTCKPACGAGKACLGTACTDDKCTTGLLHHFVDGRLAKPEDGTYFCSGCNLQTLYVLGYRRSLADEPF